MVTLLPYIERSRQEYTPETGGYSTKQGKGKGKERVPPPLAPLLLPPNLAAAIKASRFVGVEELAMVFKVQTGHTVAAQQLEILGMKTAEF